MAYKINIFFSYLRAVCFWFLGNLIEYFKMINMEKNCQLKLFTELRKAKNHIRNL